MRLFGRQVRAAGVEYAALGPVLGTPMAGEGSRVIGVVSPQATKTTTLAMTLCELAGARVGETVLGLDPGEALGKLVDRLLPPGAAMPAKSLCDLVDQLEKDARLPFEERVLQFAPSYAPFWLEVPGGPRLIVNDEESSRRIAAVTREAWRAAFAQLRQVFAVIGVDVSRSASDDSLIAALDLADHVLVPTEADGSSLNKVVRMLSEQVELYGRRELVANGTLVVTQQDPAANLVRWGQVIADIADGRVRRGLPALWRDVVLVPYDEAAGAVGWIDRDRLRPDTRLAYRRVAACVAARFAEPPISLHSEQSSGWLT